MKKKVIGALHFMPLVGYENFTNYEVILERAIKDLKVFEEGGVDEVIVENNYNLPHRIVETKSASEMMLNLTKDLAKIAKVPLGVSVLWNDYRLAFKIAKESGAKFVRIPVFVDSVKTSFGEIMAEPEKVIFARKEIGATEVKIYADVQVKHAEILEERSLTESVKMAIDKGADGIIITGKWTGDSPVMEDLKEAREVCGQHFPVIIGSGADSNNINKLFTLADQVIVSTSLKEGNTKDANIERNIKHFEAKVILEKVKEFVNCVKLC